MFVVAEPLCDVGTPSQLPTVSLRVKYVIIYFVNEGTNDSKSLFGTRFFYDARDATSRGGKSATEN